MRGGIQSARCHTTGSYLAAKTHRTPGRLGPSRPSLPCFIHQCRPEKEAPDGSTRPIKINARSPSTPAGGRVRAVGGGRPTPLAARQLCRHLHARADATPYTPYTIKTRRPPPTTTHRTRPATAPRAPVPPKHPTPSDAQHTEGLSTHSQPHPEAHRPRRPPVPDPETAHPPNNQKSASTENLSPSPPATSADPPPRPTPHERVQHRCLPCGTPYNP